MATSRELLTIHAEILGADPSIWRLVEVDSTLPLDRFHKVLQEAFGWDGYHLHLFMDRSPDEDVRRALRVVPRTWLMESSIDEGLEGFPEEEETVGGALSIGQGNLYYE
ncbi:IS1096 element passenger TnpR family protein [Zafaria sp. Z1313]|uniref:IS1096 element passenger TnpR family protein n=1 Tax=unclassified Zafaria TaxID=2828765 RepID=UPI002E77C077|nr:hypothetical protein [Zafaria sp. J156]MEE1619797.1 hypothetical protein [Zafaria sp. J156]